MAFAPSKQHWFIRYKLYHIPFWMVYNYVLWALYIGSPYEAAHELYFSPIWIKGFFYNLFPAFAVYFNLYFLIPHYLQKGRHGWYILFLALSIVASSFLIVPGYYFAALLGGPKDWFGIFSSFDSIYQAARGEPL